MVINTTKELKSCDDKRGPGVGTGTCELEGVEVGIVKTNLDRVVREGEDTGCKEEGADFRE